MKKPELPPKLWDSRDYNPFRVIHHKELWEKLVELNKEYPYWDKFKYEVKNLEIEASKSWSIIKNLTSFFGKKVKLGNDPLFSFKYIVTDNTQQLLHQFDMNLTGNTQTHIAAEDKNSLLVNALMEEAIASSRIDGADTTRRVAKDMLLAQRKPVTVSEKMIYNNYAALKRIDNIAHQPLTPELLLELHKLITAGTLDDATQEGAYRTASHINIIYPTTGEILFATPASKYIAEAMVELCHFANTDEGEFTHPIVRASVLHFLIGYIHPFANGNGRVARAIFNWCLLNRGYWLAQYMPVSRLIEKSHTQYYMAFLHTELDGNDLTYFINYQCKELATAYAELKQYVQQKADNKKELVTLVKQNDINNRQLQILHMAMKNGAKAITIKEVQTAFDVFYETARTDLLGLVDKKFLYMKKKGKAFTFLRAEEVKVI